MITVVDNMPSESWSVRGSAPPNHLTSFPLEQLTDQQRSVLSEFLRARRESQVDLPEPISFVRLLVRHKPGVVLSPVCLSDVSDYEPSISIEEVLNTFDLEYRCIGERYVAARTAWRFDFLPDFDQFSAEKHRRIGVFLGYPDADIEHFIASDPPDTPPTEYLDTGLFEREDLAFTRFVPQRHEDSIEGVERAITTGKEVWTILSRYADQWECPELTEYMRWLYQHSLEGLRGDWYLYQLHWPSKT